MKFIEKSNGCEIWHDTLYDEYYVYGLTCSGDPLTAPSLGYAREIAAAGAI